MRYMDVFLLVAAAGAFMDLERGRVDNGFLLIGFLGGLACQLAAHGPWGLGQGLLGAMVAPLALGWLFALRMLGAGDIKLLMALCAFLGPGKGLKLLWGSLVVGAALSLFWLASPAVLIRGMQRLRDYLEGSFRAGRPLPYPRKPDGEGSFPFALAILGGAILTAGGLK